MKEAVSSASWLELLAESGFTESKRIESLQDEIHQLVAICVAIIRNAKGICEEAEESDATDEDQDMKRSDFLNS